MGIPAYLYHPFGQNYFDSFNFHGYFYNAMYRLSTFDSLK